MGTNGAPTATQRSSCGGERRSSGMSEFSARRDGTEGYEARDDEKQDKIHHRFPQCGQLRNSTGGAPSPGHRRDAPLGRMPTHLGGASIASGYTPSALAGALPRPPCPRKGEKGT